MTTIDRKDLERENAALRAELDRLERRLNDRRAIDPGDGVPPGVAVADPAPEPDEATRAAKRSLEDAVHRAKAEPDRG